MCVRMQGHRVDQFLMCVYVLVSDESLVSFQAFQCSPSTRIKYVSPPPTPLSFSQYAAVPSAIIQMKFLQTFL